MSLGVDVQLKKTLLGPPTQMIGLPTPLGQQDSVIIGAPRGVPVVGSLQIILGTLKGVLGGTVGGCLAGWGMPTPTRLDWAKGPQGFESFTWRKHVTKVKPGNE